MSAPGTQRDALGRGTLFAYGLASAPAQFGYVLVLVMYLKYAVDELGMSAAAVGGIFLVAKLWDAVSDPLVGNWSDRTRARRGRRKSWLYASGPLLCIFGAMAWAPPESLSGATLIAWVTVAILGFYTAYTVFEVPHMALGAELSFDRQQRNRIFGVRQLLRTLGMFIAVTGGVYLVEQGRASAALMGVGGRRPDGAARLRQRRVAAGRARGVRRARRRRSDPRVPRRLLEPARAAAALRLLHREHRLGLDRRPQPLRDRVRDRPGRSAPGPARRLHGGRARRGSAVVRLGRRVEKRHLWLFALAQGGVGYGIVFWAGEGDWHLMAACALLAGTATACGNTLGQALKAEVIDVDEAATGERKEGAYFAAWSFTGKLASGVMIGAVGFGLEASGYVENAAVQRPETLRAMLWMMAGIRWRPTPSPSSSSRASR